jgi:Protein of unknown function (DUF2795)
MISVDAELIASVLAGMPFPASRWEIVTWAEFNGAAWPIIDVLADLPDRRFHGSQDIAAEVAGVRKEPESLCKHRRHPRSCPLHMGTNWPNTLAS